MFNLWNINLSSLTYGRSPRVCRSRNCPQEGADNHSYKTFSHLTQQKLEYGNINICVALAFSKWVDLKHLWVCWRCNTTGNSKVKCSFSPAPRGGRSTFRDFGSSTTWNWSEEDEETLEENNISYQRESLNPHMNTNTTRASVAFTQQTFIENVIFWRY